jgi:hypothetical protein
MWLALFPESLQIVSKPPNNVKSCGTGTCNGPDEDVKNLKKGVYNNPVPY